MAPEGDMVGAQSLQLTKNDLAEVKEDLKQHLTNLILQKLDPMIAQIASLSSTIKEIATTANEKNGGSIKELKAAERQLRERVAWLEQRARSMNLKLRGVPESSEINGSFCSVVSLHGLLL